MVSRKLLTSVLGLMLLAGLLLGGAHAQTRWPGKPANPGPGEMRRSYNRSGTVGQGYRPLSTWSYQNSARVNAQSLYLYGENCPEVPATTVKEHVSEIRRNVAAANEELNKLDEDTVRNGKIEDEVQSLRQNYQAIEEHCGMAEKCITGSKVDVAELCACCGSLEDELDAAHKTHQQLLDKLGIEQLDPDAAAPNTTPPKGK